MSRERDTRPTPPLSTALHTWFERLARVIAGSRRRALVVLACLLAVSAAASTVARRIDLNDDLEALLADDAPSVVALEELRSRRDAHDLLYIAVGSSDYDATRRAVHDIAERLRQWPEVESVNLGRDYTSIRDHALYFLSVEDLEKLRDRLIQERQRAIAAALRLDGSDDVDLSAIVPGDDWDADIDAEPEVEPAPAGPDEEPESVRELLEEQRHNLLESGRISEADLDVFWPRENDRGELEWPERVERLFVAPDTDDHVIEATLSIPPTQLSFAVEVNRRFDGMLAELDLQSYAPDMLAKIGGAYSSAREASAIVADLRRATGLSAFLVALVLISGFRSVRGLVIALAPLAVSVTITLACAELLFGELNVLTAFLFAVLLGIGVDFSIHLYAQRERQGPTSNWGEVLRGHLRPLAASMITTVGSFLVLLAADFGAFREFGVIASIGVFVSFAVALITVPALDTVLGPPRRRRWRSAPAETPGRALRFPWLRRGLLLAAVGVAFVGAPRVQLEKDLRALRAPQTQGQKRVGYQRALGKGRSGTAVALLADTPAQLDEAVERLRADVGTSLLPEYLRGEYKDRSWIKEVISVASYMPQDQGTKQTILQEIDRQAEGFLAELPDLAPDDPARDYATHLQALERLASQPPMTHDDIPPWAKRPFLERDGRIDRIGVLYMHLEKWNLDNTVAVANRLREIVGDTGVRGASSQLVLADLTMDVQRDTKRLPPIALVVILLLIGADMRRVSGTAACFLTLCLGLWLSFGVMGIGHVWINFYNLVVMPAVIGLGIDASIHLWHSRKLGTVSATAKAALVSALTTAGGFAGLLAAKHGGLRTIGELGVIATLACVLTALVVLGWPQAREQRER